MADQQIIHKVQQVEEYKNMQPIQPMQPMQSTQQGNQIPNQYAYQVEHTTQAPVHVQSITTNTANIFSNTHLV